MIRRVCKGTYDLALVVDGVDRSSLIQYRAGLGFCEVCLISLQEPDGTPLLLEPNNNPAAKIFSKISN